MTDIHRNILRALLIALGVTAAAGVVSVLMENETMGRVTGTGFVAVLAALISLKISVSLDNEKLRVSAMFGLGVVAIEFLLWLALIWVEVDTDKLWFTMLFFFFWSLLTALALRAIPITLSKLAGRVGIGFAAVTLFTLMIAIWGGGGSSDEWAGTTGLLGLMGLAISCAAVGIGAPLEAQLPARHWRWAGIVGGGIAIVLGMIAIWNDRSFVFDRTLGRMMSLAGLTAMFTGFANIAVLTPLKSNQRWLLHGTLAAALATCALLAMLTFEIGDEDDMLRFVAAAAIPTACGAIALAALARLNRRTEFAMSDQSYLLIHVTCPRCRSAQQFKPGKAKCDRCALNFDIKFEEPKCASCDYLLYMFEGDHCPECGNAIATNVEPEATIPTPPAPNADSNSTATTPPPPPDQIGG